MDIQARPDKRLAIRVGVPAAKLHVLHLEPIKAKVGDRWPKLSRLVHALFEKALKRAQGPQDYFLPAGELAYVATFRGQTAEEAAITCAAIAQSVCDLLFGHGAGDISVRSLVGNVPGSYARPDVGVKTIADILERTGKESLITKARSDLDAMRTIDTRLFPIWDLDKRASSFLFLSPVKGGARKRSASIRSIGAGRDNDAIATLETALLRTAAEYAQRVHAAGKVCAMATGISWETLAAPNTRTRYLAALTAVVRTPNCPLVVKIEDVPRGVPLARLAEMVTMLRTAGARVFIEFAPDIRIPDLDIKLGAVGIGIRLPDGCSAAKARGIMGMLTRRLLKQNAFAFVCGLESREHAELAGEMGVRFGMGEELDRGKPLTGQEDIPTFPLLSRAR